MKTKFTPAPWEFQENNNSSLTVGHIWADDLGVAVVHQNVDDAYLIAAAPELYEACEIALKEISKIVRGMGYEDAEIMKVLDAALAKARGESND